LTSKAASTVAEILDNGVRRLREAAVDDPARDAASLMSLVLGTDRGGVAARKPDALAEVEASRFAELIDLRARRIPMQYLEEGVEFRGLDLHVGPGALIPRPETDGLVQAVLDAGLGATSRVVDLGTGSGCIAIALAVARAGWRIVAVDLHPEALRVARVNVDRHGVADRVEIALRDFANVPPADRGTFDAVVSNPPYVSAAEWIELAPEVRDHEPRSALVPGPTGHEAYGIVAASAAALLRQGGLLALELGWKSEGAAREAVDAAGFTGTKVRPDGSGIPRVMTAVLAGHR
jgi:release factor glutamine methyltransferase